MKKNEINRFMQRALDLALKGQGVVSPNPMVGAVIVKGGRIIGEGYHKKFGSAHAEIEALKDAKKKRNNVEGATMIVTLEPCCHSDKKTPPCVPAIVEAKIKKVIFGYKDPNPLVSGKGAAELRRGGVKVELIFDESMNDLYRSYSHFVLNKKPWFAMKVASTLDGKIATRTGQSKWITNHASRELVKSLRSGYDAIIVGRGTVDADNPNLKGKTYQPMRVILDSKLSLPLSSKVYRNKNVLVLTTSLSSVALRRRYEKKDISIAILPNLSVTQIQKKLFSLGVMSALVEGGSEVFSSWVDAGAVNEVYWFVAPTIIGGEKAKSAISGKGYGNLESALKLKEVTHTVLNGDLLIHGFIS